VHTAAITISGHSLRRIRELWNRLARVIRGPGDKADEIHIQTRMAPQEIGKPKSGLFKRSDQR
jgi:hypothetical protein